MAGAALIPFLGKALGAIGLSVAAQLLFGRNDEGPEPPRLDDLSVGSSALGAILARGWGIWQFGGNIIYGDRLQEVENEVDVGKGGGNKVTTFSYTWTGAVAFCAGPLDGSGAIVTRIWADAKIVYDNTIDPPLNPTWITIYPGSETQNPSPLQEAREGVGNVPAYRGVVYAEFVGMPVDEFGARPPSFRAEVAFAVVQPGFLIEPPWPTRPPGSEQIWYWSSTDTISYGATGNGSGSGFDLARTVWTLDGVLVTNTPATYSGEGSGTVQVYGPVRNTGLLAGSVRELAVGTQSGILCWIRDRVASPSFGALKDSAGTNLPFLVYGKGVWDPDREIVYLHTGTGVDLQMHVFDCTVVADSIIPTTQARTEYVPPASGEVRDVHPVPGGEVYVLEVSAGTVRLVTIDPLNTPPTVSTIWTFAGLTLGGYNTVFVDEGITPNRCIICVGNSSVYTVYELPPAGGAATLLEQGNVFDSTGQSAEPGRIEPNGMHSRQQRLVTRKIAPGDVGLADVIADVCEIEGIGAASRDVSGVTDRVPGVAITRQATGRQFLEPLVAAFSLDTADSDHKLKFRSRSTGAVVATIEDNELAVVDVSGAKELPGPLLDTIPISRQQEDELPRSAKLKYRNPEREHETGVQEFRILTDGARSEILIEITAALTDALAAQLAERKGMEAWIEREKFSTSLGPKYLAPDTGDAVEIDGRRLRIVETQTDWSSGFAQWQLLAEDVTTLSPVTPGASDPNPPDPNTPDPGPTLLELLDVPLLRDEDIPVEIGFYFGVTGLATGWPGASLLRSRDEGTTWQQVGARSTSSASGTAQTVLADGPAGFDWNQQDWTGDANQPWDTVNTVDVLVASGPLGNASKAEVYAGANTAVLGDEVIGWETAADQGANVWRLSGLLRGRRGTEAARLTHASSERFVVISTTATGRVSHGSDELGRERLYRAPTFGADITTATPEAFTDTGISLRPFSPVVLKASYPPPGAGWDNAISWFRRSRYGTEQRDYGVSPPPLDAPDERYEVEIWDATVTDLKRIETVIGPGPFVYTQAKQNTDFADAGVAFHVKLYQLNSNYPDERGTAQAIDVPLYTDGGAKDPTTEPIENVGDVYLAGEALVAGNLLNIYDDNGARVRKADRSLGYPCDCYALETVAAGEEVTVARSGYIGQVLVANGERAYLGTAGNASTIRAAAGSGHLDQSVGTGTGAGLLFRPLNVMRRAT